ncbi:MAG: response regulator, partial [Myxococcota bacterium]
MSVGSSEQWRDHPVTGYISAELGAKVRVLVVDDNHELAEIVAEHLSVQGLSAQMVHSAAEAESAFSGSSWDVLITDLLLPDRTGHRLLARLAQLGPLPPVFVI